MEARRLSLTQISSLERLSRDPAPEAALGSEGWS